MRPRARERTLFVVLLPTLECNLDCRTCFEEHPAGRWDVASTRAVLEQVLALSSAEAVTQLRLHWQGGEALLMGTDYWSEVLELAARAAQERGIRLEQTMQTNLVAYASSFAPVVERHLGGRLGTSFEEEDDRQLGGDPEAFRRIFGRKLRAATADGLEVGVLSLVGPRALQRGAERTLERLRDVHGVRRLRFALPFAREHTRRGRWIEADAAGEFLAEAHRVWRARGGDEWLRIRPFALLEQRLAGRPALEPGLCMFAESCAEIALSVSPSGDVTLCDSFFDGSTPVWGNLFSTPLTEIFHGPGRAQTRQRTAGLPGEKCAACRWLPVCHGGCLARARPSPVTGVWADHYCAAYERLFKEMEGAGQGAGVRDGRLDQLQPLVVPQFRQR